MNAWRCVETLVGEALCSLLCKAIYSQDDFHHSPDDVSQNCGVTNYHDKFNVQPHVRKSGLLFPIVRQTWLTWVIMH